jgi:hypothetical protein
MKAKIGNLTLIKLHLQVDNVGPQRDQRVVNEVIGAFNFQTHELCNFGIAHFLVVKQIKGLFLPFGEPVNEVFEFAFLLGGHLIGNH